MHPRQQMRRVRALLRPHNRQQLPSPTQRTAFSRRSPPPRACSSPRTFLSTATSGKRLSLSTTLYTPNSAESAQKCGAKRRLRGSGRLRTPHHLRLRRDGEKKEGRGKKMTMMPMRAGVLPTVRVMDTSLRLTIATAMRASHPSLAPMWMRTTTTTTSPRGGSTATETKMRRKTTHWPRLMSWTVPRFLPIPLR